MTSPGALIAWINAGVRDRWPRTHLLARDIVRPVRHRIARWRRREAARAVIAVSNYEVMNGPFAGLRFSPRTLDTRFLSKLLGCYEAPLEPVIEEISAVGYELVVNIGSAEGYYAVGLALRLLQARVLAVDSGAKPRALCRELVSDNGVKARVEVRDAIITHEELQAILAGKRAVIVSDCEGCEFALLRPERVPALAGTDLLVELHPDRTNSVAAFLERFAATHTQRIIGSDREPPWVAERLAPLPPHLRGTAADDSRGFVAAEQWVWLRSNRPVMHPAPRGGILEA